MYFKKHTLLQYLDTDGKKRIVRNILKRVQISSRIRDNDAIFIDYDVEDGETPEMVAHKIYGRSDYHWIIMLTNQVGLLWCDWVRPQNELNRIVTNKYGAGNEYAVHHYESGDGYIVSSDYPGAVTVSNTEYETLENEKKRRIKLLRPEYVSLAEQEIEKLLRHNGR